MNALTTRLSDDFPKVPMLRARAKRAQEENEGLAEAAVRELARWAREEGPDLHGTHGSEHYSWDVPGFSRQDDRANLGARTWGGEVPYAVIEGVDTPAKRRLLTVIADAYSLIPSGRGPRVTLVPGRGDW